MPDAGQFRTGLWNFLMSLDIQLEVVCSARQWQILEMSPDLPDLWATAQIGWPSQNKAADHTWQMLVVLLNVPPEDAQIQEGVDTRW